MTGLIVVIILGHIAMLLFGYCAGIAVGRMRLLTILESCKESIDKHNAKAKEKKKDVVESEQ